MIIMLADLVPWNGVLKKKIYILNLETNSSSGRRLELAETHARWCEVLEEGEFPKWELVRKNFERTPIEGTKMT